MVAILQTPGMPTQADFHAAISSRSDRWFAACLKITRNRAMAEDAVQDALLSAWNKRHQFDNTARLDTWIHRIAVNAALQLLRKQRPAAFEPLETDVEDAADTPEAVHAEHEFGKTLSAAMTQLSEFERICFVLKHLEQWRLREIADETGSDIGAVKQAIFRAVRKLRKRLVGLRGELS
jgi:RNA polymerase sigma-70 factor (ECF subfamily)